MTAPKSAAEMMREACAAKVRAGADYVEFESMHAIDPDVSKSARGAADFLRSIALVVDIIPLPADPRDAEIAALRPAATKAADLFQWYADERIAAGKTEKAARNQGAADDLRAALAQSGEAG